MSGQRHSHLPGVGEDTPTAGTELLRGGHSWGALLTPDTPGPRRAASGVPEVLWDRKASQVRPSWRRVRAKLAGPSFSGGVPLAVLFLVLILGGPAPGGKWAPPPTFLQETNS